MKTRRKQLCVKQMCRESDKKTSHELLVKPDSSKSTGRYALSGDMCQ